MSKFSLGRMATESEVATNDPSDIVVGDAALSQVVDEMANPVDDGVAKLSMELNELSGVISDGLSNTDALLAAQDSVEASVDTGMRAAESEAVLSALNSLRTTMHFDKIHMSFESDKSGRQGNSRRLATEGLWTTIKDIFAAIINAIKRFAQWVADFFRYLFSSESKREGIYEGAAATVQDAEKKHDNAPKNIQDATDAVMEGDAASLQQHLRGAVNDQGGDASKIDQGKMSSYVLEMEGLCAPDKTSVSLIRYPYLAFMGKSPVKVGTKGAVGQEMLKTFMNAAYLVQEISEAIKESKDVATNVQGVLTNLDHEEARKLALEALLKDVTTMSKKSQSEISGHSVLNGINTVWLRRLPGDWAIRIDMPEGVDDLEVFHNRINDISRKVSQVNNSHIKMDATVPLAKASYKGGLEKVLEVRKLFMELKHEELVKAAEALAKAAEAAARKFDEGDQVQARMGHLALGVSNLLKNYSLMFATTGMDYMHRLINDWVRYFEMSARRQASAQHQIEVLVKKMVALA